MQPQTGVPASLNTNYTWNGIIEFLQENAKNEQIKQTEWMLEKQRLNNRLSKVEGELKAQEQLNEDLMKRIKMLEFCLRQERIKYHKLLSGNPSKVNLESINKGLFDNLSATDMNNLTTTMPAIDIPKRRAKGHRQLLAKLLEEVGYDDIFASANDQAEELDVSATMTSFHQRTNTSIPPNFSQTMIKNEKSMGWENDLSPNVDMRGKNYNIANDLADKGRKIDRSQSDYPPQSIKLLESKGRANPEGWFEKATLASHFDGVRGLYLPNGGQEVLVSISEDCLIKLWDLKQLALIGEQGFFEPYYTLREHTGPLFAITGNHNDSTASNGSLVVYTAGSEGIIRAWEIPNPDECDSNNCNTKNYCVASWGVNDQNESVWDLVHHPYKDQILASCADGTIKLYDTTSLIENLNNEKFNYLGKAKATYAYQTGGSKLGGGDYLIPTSVAWLNTQLRQIASGFTNSPNILIYDEETMKPASMIKFGVASDSSQQPNKILSHPTMNVLITGHEDNQIRIFDLNSNKLINSMKGHMDAVTSLAFYKPSSQLISSSHDGSLRVWDFRKYATIQEIKAHQKKYDECIHTVIAHESLPFIASGGADGVIKIFENPI